MTEQDYLDLAKKYLEKAEKGPSHLPEVHAQIAIAAALIAKIEDDRRWREHLRRAGLVDMRI